MRINEYSFNVNTFLRDVDIYIERQGINVTDLCVVLGIRMMDWYRIHDGFRPTVATVHALADVCDLELSKYRIPNR